MDKLVKGIGSLAIALLMYSAPVLTTCSLVYEWHGLIQVLLACVSIVQFILLVGIIYDNAEE